MRWAGEPVEPRFGVGRQHDPAVSKRSWAAVESLLTFCPPDRRRGRN